MSGKGFEPVIEGGAPAFGAGQGEYRPRLGWYLLNCARDVQGEVVLARYQQAGAQSGQPDVLRAILFQAGESSETAVLTMCRPGASRRSPYALIWLRNVSLF